MDRDEDESVHGRRKIVSSKMCPGPSLPIDYVLLQTAMLATRKSRLYFQIVSCMSASRDVRRK